MDDVLGLECTICGAAYQVDEVEYVCPVHGNDGILDVVYDYERLSKRVSPERLSGGVCAMWRYLPLLPVDPTIARRLYEGTTLASVGWTPLYPAPRLAARLGLHHLWVKDDGRQPTASFKDRASALAIVKARELGYDAITTASTGNAAAALAGLCAAVSQPNACAEPCRSSSAEGPRSASTEPCRSIIFVPHTAPQAKVAQLLVYGATVLLVEGTYDDAFELCLQAAPEYGWYNRNTAYNPYMSEGKKTVAYEICEQLSGELGSGQLGNWVAPDAVFVPVGDGCIIGGVYKGFADLLALRWIDRMPRLFGVQAAGSSPLVDAWERGLEGWEMEPVAVHSIADSIVAGLPRDRIKALRAVRETGGAFLRVSDDKIVAAIPALARGCGVFAEPAAAAAYAGLVVAVERGLVAPDERLVVLATGSGLKDVATAIASVGPPITIAPNLADVRRAMGRPSGSMG